MLNNNFKLFLKEFIGKTIDISNISDSLINNNFYVFCYHEITDTPSRFQTRNKLFVNKKIFKKQIGYIKKLFKIINPKELESVPKYNNLALITFDDGYKNSFGYPLNFLQKSKIVPVFFLNMSAIKKEIPLLPASLEYLEMHYKKYKYYLNKFNLTPPVSLKIKPSQFKVFNRYIELNQKKINKYQGKMVNYKYLKEKQFINKFYIADHLYEHYNCLILNKNQLSDLSRKNIKFLKKFKNYINFFSFPNGVPNKCFDKKNVNWVKNMNYLKAFSSGNTGNKNTKKFLIDRINLNNDDNTYNKFLFKIFQSTKRMD